MYDVAIGDTFRIVTDTFVVVKGSNDCNGCIGTENETVCMTVRCGATNRIDKQDVIFVKVPRETV